MEYIWLLSHRPTAVPRNTSSPWHRASNEIGGIPPTPPHRPLRRGLQVSYCARLETHNKEGSPLEIVRDISVTSPRSTYPNRMFRLCSL